MNTVMSRRERRRLLRAMIGLAYVTTPTSIIKRLTGEEAWPDAVTFQGACSFPAGTTIGGTFVGTNAPVNVTSSTLTLSAATHAGKLVTLNRAAGIAVTPPAATGTGNIYRLYIGTTVTSNTTTIDAKAGAASDVFKGWLQTYKATTFTPYVADSNLNLITLDGSTMGGIVGDYIQMMDVATNVWVISGFLTQSGTIASPFSNH